MNLPPSPPGYTLLEQIGRGGMALVYRAVQTNLARPVAIKFLEARRGPDAARFVERFRREALAASELNHRNIVTIHEFGEHEGDPFLVMELVDGFDLQSLVDEGLPIPPEILLLLLGEIVNGLTAAHARGIIHRDIKPANLLLSRNGDVKITDFGLARSMAIEQEHGGITVHGSLLGTPAYMSPEQFLGEPMDARSDIFSLGVSAYLLVTGRLPFRGLTLLALQQEILGADPPEIEMDGPGAAAVQDLLRHMLEKEPENRPPSMRALAEEIEAALDAVDPEGVLARRRQAFLERFGQDPHGLVRSLTGLDAAARLRHSAEVADGIRPVPRDARRAIEPVAEGPAALAGREDVIDPSGVIAPPRRLEIEAVRASDLRDEPAAPRPPARPAAARPATPRTPPRPAAGPRVRAMAKAEPAPTRTHGGKVLAGVGLALAAALLAFALRPFVAPSRDDHATARLAATDAPREPDPAPVMPVAADTVATDRIAAAPDTAAADPTPRETPVQREPVQANAAPPASVPVVGAGRDTVRMVVVPKLPAVTSPAVRAKSYLSLACSPPGNIYLNDRLVATNGERAFVEVPPGTPATLVVRHPDLFAAKTWSARPAPGDTVDLGRYVVSTGVLRVTTHPADPASVLIEGLETGDETPARRDISAGRHLVTVARPGWRVAKVEVLDRTDGTSRELVPSDPSDFPGVPVEILTGHDHKVTFHLLPDDTALRTP